MSRFLLSGFGADRPGMVACVTRLLLDLGVNLEDTSMTRLGGQFAMLMVFSSEDTPLSLETVERAIEVHRDRLEAVGLHVFVSTVAEDDTLAQDSNSPRYIIRVGGADRAGIVHAVAQFCADRQIDIVDVTSRRLLGNQGAIYLLLLEVIAPLTETCTQLQNDLSQLRSEFELDIQIEPVESATL